MAEVPRLVVIGVGNRDRGDDAVGPIVCDRIEQLGQHDVETLVFEGSVLDLPIRWTTTDRVVIVDAAEPARTPGRTTTVDALANRLAAPANVSTHSIDVAAAIELGRVLDRLPAELSVIGIEGAEFEFGAPLTPLVDRAADLVVAAISQRAGRPAVGS